MLTYFRGIMLAVDHCFFTHSGASVLAEVNALVSCHQVHVRSASFGIDRSGP